MPESGGASVGDASATGVPLSVGDASGVPRVCRRALAWGWEPRSAARNATMVRPAISAIARVRIASPHSLASLTVCPADVQVRMFHHHNAGIPAEVLRDFDASYQRLARLAQV